MLLVLLIIQGVISYRSSIRVLEIFKNKTPLKIKYKPHFSSVINWTYKTGYGILKQVKRIDTPWIAIIDHFIDIGVKKVFVVLRVAMDIYLKRNGAIILKDCECVGISVKQELQEILYQKT